MEDESIYVTAGIYPDVPTAQTILDQVKQLDREHTISVMDLALVTRSTDDKLIVEETKQVTSRKGAVRGGLILGLVGAAFPPALIGSVIAGAGFGALIGRIRDTGIKKDEMERIADLLQSGNAAVVVLVNGQWKQQVDEILQARGGRLLTYDLGPVTSANLAQLAAEYPAATMYL